ncbi:MAG TPA: ClbS/DfsB family four-helix bundle protein [Anaerolineaceae bacterium]
MPAKLSNFASSALRRSGSRRDEQPRSGIRPGAPCRALVEQWLMERSEGVYRRICVGQGTLLPWGIAQIEASYQQFLALFSGMSVEKMIEPGAVGKWSLKDLLAHIAVHEERMLEWLRARLRGEQPAAPQPYALPAPLIDEINEQIYQEHAATPLAEVLERFSEVHRRVQDWLASASEADLFDPLRYRLDGGEPLWAAVAANTCDHYAEHGADLQAWLKRGMDQV